MQQTLDSSDIFKSVAPADWLIAAVVLGNTLGNATKQVVIQIAVPVPAAYALGFQGLLCRISQHQCVLFVCVSLRSACVCLVYGNVRVGVCSAEVGRTPGVSPRLRTYLRQALLFPNLHKPGWQDTDLYKPWNHRRTSLSPSLHGF